MKPRSQAAVALALTLLAVTVLAPRSWAADETAELLEGTEWRALKVVTGFHSVRHKKAGLEARLFEADASPLVAHNPVALYLVVTNHGTSDLVERTWRISRGVTRVRGLSTVDCGVDVRVDVEHVDAKGLVQGSARKTLRLCFLSPEATLQATVKVSETPR